MRTKLANKDEEQRKVIWGKKKKTSEDKKNIFALERKKYKVTVAC